MPPLRIAYLPNGGFVLPLITRLNASRVPAIQALGARWQEFGLGLLGASLSTKVTMLGLLTERLYEPLLPLAGALGSASDLQEHIDGGYAWVPGDRQLPYKALLAFDAFIFEFRSAYEILGKFLVAFAEKVLGAPVKERDLLDVLAARGIATEWVAFLREHRKLFFHEQAPWIGYRVRSVDPFDGDPVFLVNVDSEPDDEDAISTRDLGLI